MELFGTAGIRGDAQDHVTPKLALSVGQAVGRDADEFVLARDGRVTGPALAAAMEAGLASVGAEVRRAGVLPTPALAYASRGRRGVMLTASHNPPHDNGVKLFVDGEEFDRTLEATVEEDVAAGTAPVEWDEWTDSDDEAVLGEYRDAVVDYAAAFGAPLDGLRIAVDCGNGVAALATPHVLRELGAEVVTLNANVDGHFPGRESKPTPETLTDLREFVADANRGDGAAADSDGDEAADSDGDEAADSDADEIVFGIGHDGDADRIVIVGPDGDVVHEDTIVAILAEQYTRAVAADDPVVVTTPNASGRIDERVAAAGGRVERVRLGALHEGITTAEAGGGDVVFAAEPWKHVHTEFGGWIDGVSSAAVIARFVADAGLDGLRDPVAERPYRKVSLDCPDEKKETAMARLESTLPEVFPEATVSTEHGVRLELAKGEWLLVRPSGTEPYIRLYGESEDVETLIGAASEAIEDAIDTV